MQEMDSVFIRLICYLDPNKTEAGHEWSYSEEEEEVKEVGGSDGGYLCDSP